MVFRTPNTVHARTQILSLLETDTAIPRTASLMDVDPDVAAAIQHETDRLQNNIELIASENVVSRAVWRPSGPS